MMRSNARGRGAQMVFPEASAAPGAAASAASRSRKASGANDTSASKKMATGARACRRSTFQASGFRARVEGDARAHDARIRRGGAAPADRRRERRLETELARPDGAEEAQVAGRTPRGVEAHLALHDLGLAADPEPLRCTHVRPVDGARRGHVDGARPEARGTAAEE